MITLPSVLDQRYDASEAFSAGRSSGLKRELIFIMGFYEKGN
jgi:hypothetical protein